MRQDDVIVCLKIKRSREGHDMPSCNWKRWTTSVTMACFFLAGGIEYSVIFPTMLFYLEGFEGEVWLYGLSLSAFSISNLFMGPLFGFAFDRTHKTRLIVLFANLFEIGGNIMYFAASSKYMILGSRFLAGVGAGGGAAIFGEVARTTTQKQRTRAFSFFMSMKLIGITIGPAFNLFLRICDFYIGPFAVNKYTAPGAFMVVIWIITEFMWLIFFHTLPSVTQDDKTDCNTTAPVSVSQGSTTADVRGVHAETGATRVGHITCKSTHEQDVTRIKADSNRCSQPARGIGTQEHIERACSIDGGSLDSSSIVSDESSPMLPTSRYAVNSPPGTFSRLNSSASYYGAVKDSHTVVPEETISESSPAAKASLSCFEMISELLREEIVVLLGLMFFTMFNQIGLEAAIVPLAKKLLHWTEVPISIFYSGAGVLTILGFIIVGLLSRKIPDRWQILFGLGLELFGYAWLLGTIGNASYGTPWVLWRFIVGIVPILFGLPFFVVTGAALYSKFLPMKIQGFGQGFRRSVFAVAAILGPLWVGGSFRISCYLLFGVPLGLLVIIMVPVLLSFRKLMERRTPRKRQASTAEDVLTASLQA